MSVTTYPRIGACVAFILLGTAFGAQGQSSPLEQPRLTDPTLRREYVDLRFSSPASGYVFTDSEILRTSDAGRSWQLLFTASPAQVVGERFFINPTTAWIYTSRRGALPAFLFRTVDGFATVEQMGLEFQRHDKMRTGFISNVFFLDAEHGWASGGSGHLAVTADGGRTWVGHLIPRLLGEPGRVVMFPPAPGQSPTEGIAKTDIGMIRTTDGGATWQAIPNASRITMRDWQCVDRSFCMQMDVLNQITTSTDGGISWHPEPAPIDKPPADDGRDQVYSLQVQSPTRAYVFGVDTHLPPRGQTEVIGANGQRVTPRYPRTSFLLTYEAGKWKRTNYPNIPQLGVGQFVDDSNGWAASSNNAIFRTTDGGQTWATVPDYYRQIAALTPTEPPFVFPTPTP